MTIKKLLKISQDLSLKMIKLPFDHFVRIDPVRFLIAFLLSSIISIECNYLLGIKLLNEYNIQRSMQTSGKSYAVYFLFCGSAAYARGKPGGNHEY